MTDAHRPDVERSREDHGRAIRGPAGGLYPGRALVDLARPVSLVGAPDLDDAAAEEAAEDVEGVGRPFDSVNAVEAAVKLDYSQSLHIPNYQAVLADCMHGMARIMLEDK